MQQLSTASHGVTTLTHTQSKWESQKALCSLLGRAWSLLGCVWNLVGSHSVLLVAPCAHDLTQKPSMQGSWLSPHTATTISEAITRQNGRPLNPTRHLYLAAADSVFSPLRYLIPQCHTLQQDETQSATEDTGFFSFMNPELGFCLVFGILNLSSLVLNRPTC